MQIVAEHVDHLKANIRVRLKETKQVLAADLGGLHRLDHLGRDLIGAAGEGCAKPEDFLGRQRAESYGGRSQSMR